MRAFSTRSSFLRGCGPPDLRRRAVFVFLSVLPPLYVQAL